MMTDERLVAAARQDDEELLLEVLENPGLDFDINYQDGYVSSYAASTSGQCHRYESQSRQHRCARKS